MSKPKKLYKALRAGMKSQYDGHKWKIGTWYKTECTELCRGFNCSRRIIDAMQYVNMEILAEVEASGKTYYGDDKQTSEEMQIVKAWKWEKKDSVALAIYSAELVIDNFEKEYPDDKRPRKAIEAARRWLKEPTQENESASRFAESAAWSAAWSAAGSAAGSAAESAARSAAESAARSEKILDKCERWIKRRIKTLEEIKC